MSPTSAVSSRRLLTNYIWYTVTLDTMLDGTSFLSDTVRVIPTDILTYLPLLLRRD